MGRNNRNESGFSLLMIAICLLSSVDHSYSVCKIESSNCGKPRADEGECVTGEQQSPIDIDTTIANNNLGPLTTDYTPNPIQATLLNKRSSIEVRFDEIAGNLVISGKSYTLEQMHWHTPSEHTLMATRYAAEVHLVHSAEDGSKAVVGILYQNGPPDSFLSTIAEKLKEIDGEECQCNETSEIPIENVVTNNMLNQESGYYRYIGSLTTSDCKEGVTWTVLKEVKSISNEQVEALKAPLDLEYKMNARSIQPLNGRAVELYNGI